MCDSDKSKYMVGYSKSFTRDEVRDMVACVATDVLKDNVENYINGDCITVNMFNRFRELHEKTNETLGNLWRDLCSEKFFEQNPYVDEVLMDTTIMTPTNNGKSGTVQKIWLASKEDVRIN